MPSAKCILHLFLYCEKLTPFFKELKEIINELRDNKGDLNWEMNFMLGMNENNVNMKLINLF